jgi:hypothetical protein
MNNPAAALPPDVAEYLDGERLSAKAGNAMLLITSDSAGTPHCALLSHGEVLARGQQRIGLVLHAGTGTADALRKRRPALLVAVVDGRAVRIHLDIENHEDVGSDDNVSSVFRAHVASVDDDKVAYARLLTGITYELTDPEATIDAWRGKLAKLRNL